MDLCITEAATSALTPASLRRATPQTLIYERRPPTLTATAETPIRGGSIAQDALRKITIDRLVKRAILEARRPAIIDRDHGLFRVERGEPGSASGGR